jgi:hypothetical protein
MPIADVRRPHIIKLTDRIAGENGPVMSDRTLTYLRQVLNWHAIRTDEYASPIVKGMMRATGRQRERILDDDELRRVASRGPRRRIRGAGEIHLADDSAARRSSETVLVRDHRTRVDASGGAKQDQGRSTPAVAAARARSAWQHAAVQELRLRGHQRRSNGGSRLSLKAALQQESGTSEWTLHDLRRTARSLVSRAGVPSEHA